MVPPSCLGFPMPAATPPNGFPVAASAPTGSGLISLPLALCFPHFPASPGAYQEFPKNGTANPVAWWQN